MDKYYEIRLAGIGIAICMIIFGILLALYPEVSGVIFTRGFAAIVFLLGLSQGWRGIRARMHEMGGTGNLIGAACLLVFSGIGFFKPEIILSFLPFVAGAFLILDGLVKIPLIREMWGWGTRIRWSGIFSALLPLLFGIILVVYPFHAAAVVIRIFGIFLLADGVSDLARSIWVKKYGDF